MASCGFRSFASGRRTSGNVDPTAKAAGPGALRDVPQLLYRLPELHVERDATVFLVEGEKDVDRLRGGGLTATTAPRGASGWKPSHEKLLAGRDVVIIPDNDPPGRSFAEKAALGLVAIAKSVKVLTLDGLAEKGDVSDWLDAGNTVDRLRELADAAPDWEPKLFDSRPGARPSTDYGNAERLVDQHGHSLRYVADWNKWLCYGTGPWQRDDDGEVTRRAKSTVRTIYGEAGKAESSEDRDELITHAKRSESAVRISAMIKLAASEKRVAIKQEDLDSDPWLLGCHNGVIDLRIGELLPHDPDQLITKSTRVEFDKTATAPRWAAFLERIMGNDESLIRFLQRLGRRGAGRKAARAPAAHLSRRGRQWKERLR